MLKYLLSIWVFRLVNNNHVSLLYTCDPQLALICCIYQDHDCYNNNYCMAPRLRGTDTLYSLVLM